MKQTIATILISYALFSCNPNVKENHESRPDQTDIEQDSASTELPQRQLNSKISEPFKVTEIDRLGFTSGGVSSVRENKFCDGLKSGFFGTYFLIDEDFSDEIGRPVGGTITVHVTAKSGNWKADDTTQTIWEIHLLSDVISVWDSIHVGQTKREVERFGQVNNGVCVKRDDFYYSCDFNNFSVAYIFKNDTLTELTVTRNCESK